MDSRIRGNDVAKLAVIEPAYRPLLYSCDVIPAKAGIQSAHQVKNQGKGYQNLRFQRPANPISGVDRGPSPLLLIVFRDEQARDDVVEVMRELGTEKANRVWPYGEQLCAWVFRGK